MEIIRSSLRAREIQEIAYDLGLQSPHIATTEEWGGTKLHMLTFGPRSNRQIVQIPGRANEGTIRELLLAALEPPAPKIEPRLVPQPVQAQEPPPPPLPKAQVEAWTKAEPPKPAIKATTKRKSRAH